MTTRIVVTDASRCCRPAGDTMDVSDARAARWVANGWAAYPTAAPVTPAPVTKPKVDAPADTADDGMAGHEDVLPRPPLPMNRSALVDVYVAEIGKEPTKADLGKVTRQTLTTAIKEHRAAHAAG